MTKTTTPDTADLLARTSQEPPAAPPPTELERVKAELHLMKTAGVIEVAARNPSVSEHMEHWEGRATKAEARIAELEDAQRFTISDGQRLLRKCDIQGVCDTPDLCFEDADTTARCGPCASKLAAQAGVDVNFYTFSNPQAMRLSRRITALERALDEIITEATSRNHAIDIARRARHGEGRG